jgi:ribosomal protein S18
MHCGLQQCFLCHFLDQSPSIEIAAAQEGSELCGGGVQVRSEVDYRKIAMLLEFTGRQGMILPRRRRQIRAVTQAKVARAIKNARQMALMPFVGMHPAVEDEDTFHLRDLFESLDEIAVEEANR